jgi:hypothetical protein
LRLFQTAFAWGHFPKESKRAGIVRKGGGAWTAFW